MTCAQTIGDRLMEMGLLAMGDERGAISHQQMQYSSGLEVTISNCQNQKRLSANSGVGVLSLKNVRELGAKWPLVMGRNGEARGLCEKSSASYPVIHHGGERSWHQRNQS